MHAPTAQEWPHCCAAVDQEPRKILIVEDDPSLAEVLSIRLQRQGYLTTAVNTGAAALEAVNSVHPQLVLLDIRLPDIDGLSICEQWADTPATCDIPVIAISGMDHPDIIRRARSAGCRYFLRKPYDPNALLVLIKDSLAEQRDWQIV